MTVMNHISCLPKVLMENLDGYMLPYQPEETMTKYVQW